MNDKEKMIQEAEYLLNDMKGSLRSFDMEIRALRAKEEELQKQSWSLEKLIDSWKTD